MHIVDNFLFSMVLDYLKLKKILKFLHDCHQFFIQFFFCQVPVVETKFTLFEMEVEVISGEATKLRESSFCPSPKTFNTVDMVMSDAIGL